jgi:hypothetical protein
MISRGTASIRPRCEVPRVDDNDLAGLLDSANRAYYKSISNLREQVKGYKDILKYSSNAEAQQLISGMEERLSARKRRIGLSLGVGVVALGGGVIALWNASSVGVGFHQTILIAVGGALITFCLVELILDKIIEIPGKEARKLEKLLNDFKAENQKQEEKKANIIQNLLTDTDETDASLDRLLLQLKSSFGDEP